MARAAPGHLSHCRTCFFMTTLPPIAPMPLGLPSAQIAAQKNQGRSQMSLIHPAMVETVALSPAPLPPSPAPSGPSRDFFTETPARDVEAQLAPDFGPWQWPKHAWEPMVASTLSVLVPSLSGATIFGLVDGLQQLTDSAACPAHALNFNADAWGVLGGALLVGIEYQQAAHYNRIDLLTLRAAMLSAGVAASVDVVASTRAMLFAATQPSCALPTVMRSSGSVAACFAFASEFAAAHPEHLYAAGQTLGVPLHIAGRAVGFAARRVWRRRWH